MGVPDVVVWPIGVVRILTESPWPSKCNQRREFTNSRVQGAQSCRVSELWSLRVFGFQGYGSKALSKGLGISNFG